MNYSIDPAKLTEKILLELAKKTGESQEAVLEKALEAYRRQCFLEENNAAFAALRGKRRLTHKAGKTMYMRSLEPNDLLSKRWQQEQEERAAWDTTLADGLEEG